MQIVAAMATIHRFLSNVGGAIFALTLSSLCACAPEYESEEHIPRVSSSTPPPSTTETETSDPSAARPAAPEAPPKQITPIALYTVSGTFVPAREGYQADIAKKVDPKFYDWVPIDYPASLFPMNSSMNQGVASLVAQIKARPGKFALVGFSQGGAIVSKVYDEIRSGSLKDRRQDLVVGVALGNPMREAGHTIPGGTDPGGRGIMGQRLVDSGAAWWDFCAPNDLACSVPDDAVGREYTALFDILMLRFDGRGDPVQLVLSYLTNPLQILTQFQAITTAVQGILTWAIPGAGNGAHGAYPIIKPIPNDPRTSIELAVDYLNLVAAAQ